MNVRALLLGAVVVLAPSVSRADSVITFEGYPSGTVFTTQFPGVNFNGATVLTAGISLNPNFPPHSGVNVVYNPSGPMTVNFSSPVQYFEGYFTYNSGLTINAYNSSSSLLSSFVAPCTANYLGSGSACSPNELGEVTGLNISYVVITGGGGNNFTLDDAQFTGSVGTTVTPEPSSLVLLGTGLLGFAGTIRRRLLS